MRWMTFAVLTLGLTGCPEGNGDDPDGERIPEPLDNPHPYDSDCDGFEGTPVAGATGWFVGEYAFVEDDRVEGYEAWALLANDEWKEAAGADDCTLIWNVAGVVGEPENCPSCQFSMTIDANLNLNESDCIPQFIQAHNQPFTETYNVRENSDGTTEFFFAASANLLGVGTSDNQQANFRGEPRCFFF